MRFVCGLWCINCVLVLAWGVGQGSGERWRRWRLPEGSRGGVWKTRSCRGGAILQVGLIKMGRDMVPIAHYAQFLSLAYLFFCRQREREQLEMLRNHHEEEIEHHRKEIERLQKEIDRHKGKIRKLKHDDWSLLPMFWSAHPYFSQVNDYQPLIAFTAAQRRTIRGLLIKT